MPLVRVPAGIIRVPDGVSQDEIIRVVKERGLDKPSGSVTQGPTLNTAGMPSPRPEQSEFSKGVSAGVDSLQGSLYGLAALVGDTFGHEGLTQWGLENYQRNQEEATRANLAVTSLSDIDDVGDFFNFASGAIGQAVPSLLSTAAGGGAGGLVGRAVAKKAVERMVAKGIKKEIAEQAVNRTLKDPQLRKQIMSAVKLPALNAKRGALGGALVSSSAQQQGALFADLKKAGIEDAALPAWAFGAVQGGLDIVGEVALVKRLMPGQVEKELAKSLARGVMKGTSQQAALEGATEGAQSAVGSFARILNGEDESWTAEDTRELIDNTAAGAIVGVVLGGPASFVENIQNRPKKESKKEPTRDTGQSRRKESAGATVNTGTSRGQPSTAGRTNAGVQGQPAQGTPAQGAVPDAGTRQQTGAPVDVQQIARRFVQPTSDTPSAEPRVDLEAQLRDLRDPQNPRRAVLLSRDNLRHNEGVLQSTGGLRRIPNADGRGGILVTDEAGEASFLAALDAGVPREVVIGRMTLSGEGKQPGADTVVQQKTPDGAVARETLVPAEQAETAAQELQAPGRTVQTTTPEQALQRREQAIAQERTVTTSPVEQLIADNATKSRSTIIEKINALGPEAAAALKAKHNVKHLTEAVDAELAALRGASQEQAAPGSGIVGERDPTQLLSQSREQAVADDVILDDLSIPGSAQQAALVAQLRSMLPKNDIGEYALQWAIENNKIEAIGRARDEGRKPFNLAAAVIAQAHGINTINDEPTTPRQQLAMREIRRLLARQQEVDADPGSESELDTVEDEQIEDEQIEDEQIVGTGLTGLEADRPFRYIGAHDRMHDTRLPPKPNQPATKFVVARPFKNMQDAQKVAASRQAEDSDATYIAEWLTEEQAREAGLPASGIYVSVYPRASAELIYNVNAGGQLTPAQATRLYLARAARRWQNYPRHFKDRDGNPARVNGRVYGFTALEVSPEGDVVRKINLASSDIAELGFAVDPDLRKNGMTGIRDAFRLGITHLLDRKPNSIIPASLRGENPSFPAGLVLREENKRTGVAEVTLGQAHRAANARSAKLTEEAVEAGERERTRVAPPGKRPDAIADAEPFTLGDRRTIQRNGPPSPTTDPRDLTPVFERRSGEYTGPDGDESFDQRVAREGDQRPFESEEAQNRRSTGEFAPGGNVGTARATGNSAIGTVGAGLNRQPSTATVEQPRSAPRTTFLPTPSPQERRLGLDPAERNVAPTPAPPPRPAQPVEILSRNQDRASLLGKVAEEVRSILKLNKNFIISDDRDMFLSRLRAAGFDYHADDAARRIDAGNRRAFIMRTSGNARYIWVNPDQSTAMQIKGLLHEIGHVFFEQYWGDTSIEMRKSLVNAFEEFLDKNPNFRPDAKSYDAKFKEWLADQVAAWVAADKTPRTAIERWFKELADVLRRAWAAIRNAYPLSDAVSNYIHDVITTYDSKLDPSLDSLGAANSVFYDDMSDAVRQPPEKLRQLGTKVRAFKAKHPTLGKMLDTITGTVMAAHEAATARLHMRIRRLNNPVFNQILRVFHHAAGESGGFTYDTLVANRIRNFTQRYDAIIAGVEDAAAFFEIMRNEQAIDSMPEKFQKPAKEMRDLLNQLYAYQVEAGLPIQFVAYYFPQVGDAYELAKPDAADTIYRAIQDAGVKWNTPQGEVDITMDMVRGWVESLSDDTTSINFDPGRIEDVQSNMRAPFQQALRARVLQPQVREVIRNIKNEKGQARFYAKSMDEVMHRYIRQAVRRAEYNRIFGEDARNIPPSQNNPRQPARPWNPHAKFEQMMNESKAEAWQKELMYDAMSAFLGNYGRIRSEPVRRMVKSVAFYQNLRTLLLVTISSFPEFATLFLRTGNFGQTWRVIRENAADAWRKGGDTYKMLRTFGFAVDELDAFAFKEFYDARDYDSKINRLNESWFRAIGLTRWTNFIRGLSLHVSLDYMKEHARRVADGFDETGDSQRRLEELGISVEDLRTWARLGEPIHGQIGATIEDVRRGKSNMTEEELAVVERVTGAITRMINEIVVNPTAAMKPLWRSSERASLVSQLGSFTYGFLDTVLSRVWHELTRQGAPTMARAVPLISLAMMLPIAALGLELKELFQYTIWGKEPRTDGMSGPEYLQTLISRTGVLGVAQLGVDAYEAASYGRDPIGVLLGPTVSQVNSAFRDIGKAQDTSRAVIKTTLGAIPFLSSAPGARDRLTPEPEN